MASKTCVFFETGTNAQFEYVLKQYPEAIKAKAHNKSSKPETLLKLDNWYQNELPKKMKSRGKELYLTHDEIVMTIKWKLARGIFRPRLKDLVQMNTPRVVMQETKKAFRNLFKKKDIESAVAALSNLKGVGPAMASAVLAAGAPEVAPFMADECLLSMPDIEGIDYTMKEYIKLVEKTKECVERLNSQGGTWTPHTVELAIWTHYIARDIKPELLDDMPGVDANKSPNKYSGSPVNGENEEEENVNGEKEGESSGSEKHDEDSCDSVVEQNGAENQRNGASTESNEASAELNGASEAHTSSENGSKETENNVTDEKHVNGSTESTKYSSEEAEINSAVLTETETAVPAEKITPAPVENSTPAPVEKSSPAPVENGTASPAENGTSSPVENGSAHNGVETNGDSTKEETVKPSCDKRPLEEESLESEPKRLKDDMGVPPPPIPAGGD